MSGNDGNMKYLEKMYCQIGFISHILHKMCPSTLTTALQYHF